MKDVGFCRAFPITSIEYLPARPTTLGCTKCWQCALHAAKTPSFSIRHNTDNVQPMLHTELKFLVKAQQGVSQQHHLFFGGGKCENGRESENGAAAR